MLKAEGLTVYRAGLRLIEGAGFVVDKNECLAVVGDNNSGKSSLLATLARPDIAYEGRVEINHVDKQDHQEEIAHAIGYLPSPAHLESSISAADYLEFIGAHFNMTPKARNQRISDLAQMFGVKDQIYNKSCHLSASSRQKVAIIASLIHQPNLLIWDNPETFLDQKNTDELADYINNHLKKTSAIIVASLNQKFLTKIADNYLIIDNKKATISKSLK